MKILDKKRKSTKFLSIVPGEVLKNSLSLFSFSRRKRFAKYWWGYACPGQVVKIRRPMP